MEVFHYMLTVYSLKEGRFSGRGFCTCARRLSQIYQIYILTTPRPFIKMLCLNSNHVFRQIQVIFHNSLYEIHLLVIISLSIRSKRNNLRSMAFTEQSRYNDLTIEIVTSEIKEIFKNNV